MSRRQEKQREAIKYAIEATANKVGVVTPEGVVKAARDPRSPLHAEFEWDDSIAAHQHRLAVARSLIREVRYVTKDITNKQIATVEYVHIPGRGQGYIPLSRAARDKSLAREILVEELARCESAINRARDVAKVLGLSAELEALLVELIALKRRAVKKVERRRGQREQRLTV